MAHFISFYSGNTPHNLLKKDVYDTCYFILLWKIPHKWPKKARYHDAAYDTCYFILLWKISHKWPKKARYHDAVYDTRDNTSLVKCLQTFAQKNAQYHNAVNDTRYLILFWEYPTQTIKKLGTMMPCMTHVISCYYGKSHVNGPKKLGTMMPCMTHVILFYFGKSHINGPKKIGTMML